MVLAQTKKLDVLHQHHFVVAHAERSPVEQMLDVLVIPARQESKCFLKAFGCLAQTLAIGIFPDQLDNFRNVARDRLRIALLGFVQEYFLGRLGHWSSFNETSMAR